jgi:hypothetical protein
MGDIRSHLMGDRQGRRYVKRGREERGEVTFPNFMLLKLG